MVSRSASRSARDLVPSTLRSVVAASSRVEWLPTGAEVRRGQTGSQESLRHRHQDIGRSDAPGCGRPAWVIQSPLMSHAAIGADRQSTLDRLWTIDSDNIMSDEQWASEKLMSGRGRHHQSAQYPPMGDEIRDTAVALAIHFRANHYRALTLGQPSICSPACSSQ